MGERRSFLKRFFTSFWAASESEPRCRSPMRAELAPVSPVPTLSARAPSDSPTIFRSFSRTRFAFRTFSCFARKWLPPNSQVSVFRAIGSPSVATSYVVAVTCQT